MCTLFSRYLKPGFLRSIAKNGYLPGVTFVQAMTSCNLEPYADLGGTGMRGLAKHYNGAFVDDGAESYSRTIGDKAGLARCYNITCIHEMGHTLLKLHAHGIRSDGVQAVAAGDEQYHDSHGPACSPDGSNAKYGTCAMTYRDCEGVFCARCLFELRGWKIRAATLTANDAAPPAPEIIP
ncbi:MAG: hypothetical protein JSU94_04195 [Phycisphaerales bacterium]|nr:MAG: hypothetical protein JSU94_04195 [Phycisphaerales bacterium]